MKQALFLLTLPLLLTSCYAKKSSSKEEQIELSLHKVRTELEDIKHDLNTYEIEHHVLEGKVVEQTASLSSLKQTALKSQSSRLEKTDERLEALESKLTALIKQQDKLLSDVRGLSSHANDTKTALSQYKEKLAEIEKQFQKEDVIALEE